MKTDTTLRDELEGIKLTFRAMKMQGLSPTMKAYLRGRLDTLINLSADCANDVMKEAIKMLCEEVG
jgi:hypothetical protein